MSAARSELLRLPAMEGQDVSLVDAAEEPASVRELVTQDEAHELEKLRAVEGAQRAADAVANLTLNPVNLRRAAKLRAAFERAEDDSDAAERLLLELVAGETSVALELQDVEAALTSLLGQTVTNPKVAGEVAKVLRETVLLGNAIRRRVEGSLSAAAGLKAQRVLLATQRGRLGV